MNNEAWSVKHRRDFIREYVRDHVSVTTDRLLEILGLSKMTLWRDLKALEDNGFIERYYGGVTTKESTDISEPTYARKTSARLHEKKAIGFYLAKNFIKNDCVVILEGGTTVLQVVPFLITFDLTILTNGLYIMNDLAGLQKNELNIISCGGILRNKSLTFVGPEAELFFKKISADLFVVSGTGLSVEKGLTETNLLEIQVKQAMMSNAKKTVVAIDSSKLHKRSMSTSIPIENIGTIITDYRVKEEDLLPFKELDIDIHVAPPVDLA